jgi:outer membrane lipoprotein-sorting protein
MKLNLRFLLTVATVFCCATVVAAEQQMDEQKIVAALNQLKTFKAEFRQVNEDGTEASGMFYMDRPNQRLRFIYKQPAGTSILARDGWLKIYDADQDEEMSLSLDETPAYFFLNGDIDLQSTQFKRHIFQSDADVRLLVHDGNSGYTLILYMTLPDLTLLGWDVKDINGKWTRLRFKDSQTNTALSESLFVRNKSFTSHRDK